MEHLSPNQRAWRRFLKNKPAVVSACFLLGVALLVLVWPWLTPYSPTQLSNAQSLPPTGKHWFGTDVHGRDLLARVFAGARISLLVGLVGAAVSLCIGVVWGAVAGYVGGKWD